MKPVREFNGTVGEFSINAGGPDYIEKDLDKLMVMMDPAKTHVGGESGGLKAENFNPGVGDDAFVGPRTVDDDLAAPADTGTLTQLFSWVTGRVKAITGKSDWKTAPAKSLETLAEETDTLITGLEAEEQALAAHKDSADHDERYFSKTELGDTTDGASGADRVAVTTVSGLVGNTVQAVLEALKAFIDGNFLKKDNTTPFSPSGDYAPATVKYVNDTAAGVALGNVPDKSIGAPKLADDVQVGSLTALAGWFAGAARLSVTAALNAVSEALTGVATLTGAETLTNKTLSAPKITSSGAIKDANGNEILRFPASVPNAVNDVTLKNAASGQAPGFSASGDDAVIDFNVETKGGGVFKVNGEHYLKGPVQSPTITYGQNLITNPHIADAYPDITFQGRSYVNLLGADGNCEDLSKWSYATVTASLDTTKKVFGANALKLTLTASSGYAYKIVPSFNLDVTKHYLFSAYLDKGNTTGITFTKDPTGGGVSKVVVSTSVVPTRSAFKCQPSDIHTSNNLLVVLNGASGQYAYVDGIMVNEITATEYANDSVDVLMARYPYIDSYACLQNPAVEVVHDNMVRNGNGEEGIAWWEIVGSPTKATFENGYFVITDDDAVSGEGFQEYVPVKPSTSYQLIHSYKAGSCNARIVVTEFDSNKVSLTSTVYTATTSSVTDVVGNANLTSGVNTGYFRIALLTGADGTAVGTCYHKEIQLIPGTVAPTAYKPQRREQCVIEGKFATGDTVRLKDGKLEGTLQWEHKTLYGRDNTYAYVGDASGFKNISVQATMPNTAVSGYSVVKNDGKILKYDGSTASADTMAMVLSSGLLYLAVADTDTGWAESIAPNAAEVAAFMNGYKANANNGTRYTSWLDPQGAAPATNTIAYVSTTVAPLYKGYQLHYQLANPKAVNEYNTRLKGNLPKLESGMNVVNVDAGRVVGEVVNPVFGSTTYNINSPTTAGTLLTNLLEDFKAIYRNKVKDELFVVNNSYLPGRGNASVSCLAESFDPKAQYTVDYTILRTAAPVVGTPLLEYTPGVTKKVQPIMNQPAQFIFPSTTAPSNDFGFDGDICFTFNPNV